MSNRFSIGKSSVAITMIAVTALFLGLTFSPKVVKAEPMKIDGVVASEAQNLCTSAAVALFSAWVTQVIIALSPYRAKNEEIQKMVKKMFQGWLQDMLTKL